jgi:hypothetical protein
LYSPPKTIAYHLWERNYRKTYKEDHRQDLERLTRQKQCLEFIKSSLTSDKEFLDYLKCRAGVDLESGTFTEEAGNGFIDT